MNAGAWEPKRFAAVNKTCSTVIIVPLSTRELIWW
jgi:hypothetical protein